MHIEWKSTKLNFPIKFYGISEVSFLPFAFLHSINIYQVQIMFCENKVKVVFEMEINVTWNMCAL